MSTMPKLAEAAPKPLTLGEALSDVAIIILLSVLIVGLVVVLHTVLPPIA